MPTIEEKRVYDDRTGQTELYVASGVGVVLVTVSDDLVGEFSLAMRCDPRDVAAGGGDVAVAADEDVLALVDAGFESTGFGPAVAVDIEDGVIVAADAEGTVSRRPTAPATATAQWTAVGRVEGAVTAIDWPFVATDSGLYRAVDPSLGGDSSADAFDSVGLDAVNDVSATGVPLAATDTGLYRLGNGWMSVIEEPCHAVASDGTRAHAATERALYEYGAEWTSVEVPVTESIRDMAYTPTATACVTGAGTVLLTAGDGWRKRALGVDGIVGVAVR